MAIYVTGDTHGAKRLGAYSIDGFMHRLNTASFPEQKMMSGDDNYVVICGDFGGVWTTQRLDTKEPPDEAHCLDWLNDKPFTTLVVPGNHENYDRLTGIKDEKLLNSWLFEKLSKEDKKEFKKGYPKKKWNGGYVRVLRPNVLLLEPGVFTINDKKCFVYGGARCHDIQGGILNPSDYPDHNTFKRQYERLYNIGIPFRVKGVSWWEQEEPGKDVEKAALKALDSVNWMVDFVFSHDCSTSDRAILGYTENTRVTDFLEKVKQRLDYRHWFFGHLHNNYNLPGGKDHLLYEQIIRIQ